jgi:WD40 repeat protein
MGSRNRNRTRRIGLLGLAVACLVLVGADGNCGSPEHNDTDGDGVADAVDNCPSVANSSQADADGDGIGDACEGSAFTDPNGNGSHSDGSDQGGGSTDGNTDGDGDSSGTTTCTEPPCRLDPLTESPAQGDYRHWSFPLSVSIGDLAISGDGRRIVVGDQGSHLRLFDRNGGTPVWTYTVELEQFNSVDISRDGLAIVAACTDAKVYFFQCDSGTPAWVFDTQGSRGSVVDVAISSDGCYIAVADYDHVYLLARGSNVPLRTFTPAIERGDWLTTVEIAGDGSVIAAGTWISSSSGSQMFIFDHTRLLWTHNTDYQSQSENAVKMPIALSHDGARIACGGADRRLYFFDGSATPAWSLEVAQNHDDQVSSVSLSNDGRRLAVGGDDRCIFFDDTLAGTPTWDFDGDLTPVGGDTTSNLPCGDSSTPCNFGIGHYDGAIALSADGKYVVAGAYNSGHVWDLYRGLNRPFRMYTLSDEYDPVSKVAVSADGAWVVTGSVFAGELALWEVAPAELIEIGTPLTFHVAAAPGVADAIDSGSIHFTRYLVKPGRAATLRERWSLWANIQGLIVFPAIGQLMSGGETEKSQVFELPAGNYDQVSQESMTVPRFFESFVSTVTVFLLQAELLDDPTRTGLSEDWAVFADVQVGAVPGS